MTEHTSDASPTEGSGFPGLLQGLVEDSGEPAEQLLAILLHAARSHLCLEIGFISEFSGDRRYFRLVDEGNGHGLIEAGDSDPREETYCQRCVDGRLPSLILDAQALPAALDLPVTSDLGIGAHMSVPILLADGTIYGTFCCFSLHADHTLGERDVSYLRAFADVASGLIQSEVDQVRERDEIRTVIQSVLNGEGLEMVWQPIVDLNGEHIGGVEALARFSPPPGSTYSKRPDVWFAEARRVGMGEQLEQEAMRRGLVLLEELPANTYVSVNVSAQTFLSSSMQDFLSGLRLERVVVEITEHDAISDYIELSEAMRPLRRQGLRLAVDDLGAGYASLRHLLRLNPDIIKLDISITRGIDGDEHRKALVAGLVGYALTARSKLVAEGVETNDERDALELLGVNAVQGYLLHRPQTREVVMNLFR